MNKLIEELINCYDTKAKSTNFDVEENFIFEIESELILLLKNKRTYWFHINELTYIFKENKLFKRRGFNSFSAWVTDFCSKNNIIKSGFWERLRASKILENYTASLNSSQKKQAILNTIEKNKVAFSSFVVIEKITTNPTEQAILITELLSNKITHADLLLIYKNPNATNIEDVLLRLKLLSTLKDLYYSNNTFNCFTKKTIKFKLLQNVTLKNTKIDILLIQTNQNLDILTHSFVVANDNQYFNATNINTDFTWLVSSNPQNISYLNTSIGFVHFSNETFKILQDAKHLNYNKIDTYKKLLHLLI